MNSQFCQARWSEARRTAATRRVRHFQAPPSTFSICWLSLCRRNIRCQPNPWMSWLDSHCKGCAHFQAKNAFSYRALYLLWSQEENIQTDNIIHSQTQFFVAQFLKLDYNRSPLSVVRIFWEPAYENRKIIKKLFFIYMGISLSMSKEPSRLKGNYQKWCDNENYVLWLGHENGRNHIIVPGGKSLY